MSDIRFITILPFIFILFISGTFGQSLTMKQIEYNLVYNPPTLGNEILREQTILELDDILALCGSGGTNSPEVEQFYFNMMEKVKAELKQTIDGTSIWMMYNHGFIVKTEHNEFAIDLIKGYIGWSPHILSQEIIDQIQLSDGYGLVATR